ncbi:MAG: toxin [Acidobacteria bacterium]|nr:toxin [Acidobacteriota bacterium]
MATPKKQEEYRPGSAYWHDKRVVIGVALVGVGGLYTAIALSGVIRADPRRGKGRRGGLWIIYLYFESEKQIWLMMLYGKHEAADLSAKEKKALKTAIELQLKARAY